MPPLPRRSPPEVRRAASNQMRDMLATKSHAWEEVGLAKQLSQRAARRARAHLVLVIPLLVGILLLYAYRDDLFGGRSANKAVPYVTVLALVILGWQFARDIGRAMGPTLLRRMDPGTAGTFGFLIRLATVGITLLVALRITGLRERDLAVGAAVTAVVIGLAAQQTLGNLIAGTVLLSARPFRVGERIGLAGSGIEVEGVVSSLGLLFTVLAQGEDTIMIPNSILLTMAITPLREPESVDLRARLRSGVKPSDVQGLLNERVTVKTRNPPRIALQEVDGDEVVVRILATPELAVDGPQLADEVLTAIQDVGAREVVANEGPVTATATRAPGHGVGPPEPGNN